MTTDQPRPLTLRRVAHRVKLPGRPIRAQVLTQAVLLRRAGYRVSRAEVSYVGSRTKVQVEVADDAEAEVAALVAAARYGEVCFRSVAVGQRSTVPAVLAGRPVFAHDETNALLERSEAPPRTIVPRDPDAQPLYVGAGATVALNGLRVTVENQGRAACRREARGCLPAVCCRERSGHNPGAVGTLASRCRSALPRTWRMVQRLVPGPTWEACRAAAAAGHRTRARGVPGRRDDPRQIHNQRILLRRNAKTGLPDAAVASLRTLSAAARDATTIPELLGIEGAAAGLYFENFDRMISPQRSFGAEFLSHGRARRPAPDPRELGPGVLLLTCWSKIWLRPSWGLGSTPTSESFTGPDTDGRRSRWTSLRSSDLS